MSEDIVPVMSYPGEFRRNDGVTDKHYVKNMMLCIAVILVSIVLMVTIEYMGDPLLLTIWMPLIPLLVLLYVIIKEWYEKNQMSKINEPDISHS